MIQVVCNKCGRIFEEEDGTEWGYCPFCENDQVEISDDTKNWWKVEDK